MSVQFEEDGFISKNFSQSEEKGFSLARFLVQKNIVRDMRMANIVLIIISAVIIIGSFVGMYYTLRTDIGTVNYEDLPLNEKMKLPVEVRERAEKILLNNEMYAK